MILKRLSSPSYFWYNIAYPKILVSSTFGVSSLFYPHILYRLEVFMSATKLLQDVQFYDKYSRYRYDLGRREDWKDTVDRVTDYLFSFDTNNVLTIQERSQIYDAIYNKEVMPSMRNLAMAGEAAVRQNACSYNCAYMTISDFFAYYEAVIILMSGSGLGYSVEKKYVEHFPVVKEQYPDDRKILFRVPDTTEGWAEAIYFGITNWYSGYDVKFDFSQVRPAGSVLKVKGGRASGHAVLAESLVNIRQTILNRQGEKLNTLDVHDIMCHVAKCIVSGGVRRSAMISIFDYDDTLMLTCKNSENIEGNEQRYLANNSAVIENELTLSELREFMNNMFASYSGEPGILSRYAVKQLLPKNREFVEGMGTNPCGEIVLRPFQFCNLSSVVCRPDDDLTSLRHKVKIATIIGTIQAMSDNFPGLRKEWKENQVKERLLGVDLNGIMDVPFVQNERVLEILYKTATDTNHEYSIKLGINRAAGVTCVKPSGNASVLLDTSPGIHARWSDNYIRRVQLSESNPILHVLKEYNVPVEESSHLANTSVASFPIKAPEGAITNGTYSAIEQLENWRLFNTKWADHSVSCTIAYYPDEQEEIVQWLYNNQYIISGLSFLPKDDAVYEQMPYEKISEQRYNELSKNFPEYIDWNLLHLIEQGDNTNAFQTTACSSNKCELTF